MDSTNTIFVSQRSISCDGGPQDHHPKIYLEIDNTNKAECPYCGNIFIYKEE
jgi:uncharacterized Zn-finger protein